MKEVYTTENGIKWIITENSDPELVRILKGLMKIKITGGGRGRKRKNG